MAALGKLFLAAVLKEGSVSGLLGHGSIDHLFKASEKPAYDFVRQFVKQYAKLPSEETIYAHTDEELPEAPEPPGYYHDLLNQRHIELTLKKAMKEASEHLTVENKDPDGALKIVADSVMSLMVQKHAKQIVDFREAHDLIIGTYAGKNDGSDDKSLKLGWRTLDDMSGGLMKGDLISIVGRPQRGKTWFQLYAALFGWQPSKEAGAPPPQSRMFVSMEMNPLLIQQRLAAMQTHVKMTNLKLGTLGSIAFKQLKAGLTEIKGFGAPFWVVDGNLTATVEDIWMMARQLAPDALFIDGGYLVKHPTERDRYRRVAENSNLMKRELTPICPTCVSWQFARSATKKKKDEKVTMDDIGYTDAIAQDSSLALGLMEEESVETLKYRMLDVLKGRSGETGSFKVNWNFDTMDFSEVVDKDVSELQFL